MYNVNMYTSIVYIRFHYCMMRQALDAEYLPDLLPCCIGSECCVPTYMEKWVSLFEKNYEQQLKLNVDHLDPHDRVDINFNGR